MKNNELLNAEGATDVDVEIKLRAPLWKIALYQLQGKDWKQELGASIGNQIQDDLGDLVTKLKDQCGRTDFRFGFICTKDRKSFITFNTDETFVNYERGLLTEFAKKLTRFRHSIRFITVVCTAPTPS